MKIIFRSTLLLLLVAFGSSLAYSCSCEIPNQRERYRKANAVFVGEVLELKERPRVETSENLNDFPYQVTFRVEKQWKGKRQSEVTALSDYENLGMCNDLYLEVGKRFLVYAPRKNGRLIVYAKCGPNVPANNEYTDEEIEKLDSFFFRASAFLFPYPKF